MPKYLVLAGGVNSCVGGAENSLICKANGCFCGAKSI